MTRRTLLVGCVMAMVADKKLPASTLYLAQRRDRATHPHIRVLHQVLARSRYESKVQFIVEDTWPFRERASGQNGRLNPLRMDITTEMGGHSSTTTRDARIRRFGSTLPSLTLAPAPIWRMQYATEHNTSPTQSSGRKTSIGARSPQSTKKQTNSLGTAKQTGFDRCSREKTNEKQSKQFLSGRWRGNECPDV